MYLKNLTEDFRLRLTADDMEFLKNLSVQRGTSVSELVRQIIGDYRRSYDTLNLFNDFLRSQTSKNGGLAVHNGDTKTDLNDKL